MRLSRWLREDLLSRFGLSFARRAATAPKSVGLFTVSSLSPRPARAACLGLFIALVSQSGVDALARDDGADRQMLREQQRQQQQMLKQAEQQRRAAEKAMIAAQREAERALKAQQAEAARQQREAEKAQAAAQREAERAALAAQREVERATLAAQKEAERAAKAAELDVQRQQRAAEKAQQQAQIEAERAQRVAQKDAERQAREAAKAQQAAQREAEKAQAAARKEAESQTRDTQASQGSSRDRETPQVEVRDPQPVVTVPVVAPTVREEPVIVDRRDDRQVGDGMTRGDRETPTRRDTGQFLNSSGDGRADRADPGKGGRQIDEVGKTETPPAKSTDDTVASPVVPNVGQDDGRGGGETRDSTSAAGANGNKAAADNTAEKPNSSAKGQSAADRSASLPGQDREVGKPPVSPSSRPAPQASSAPVKATDKPAPDKTANKDQGKDKSKDKAQANSKSAKGVDDLASTGPDWLPTEARVRKAERQMLVPGLSKDERGRLERLGFRVIETPAQSPATPGVSPPSGAAGGSSSGGASSGQTSQPSGQAPSAARLVRVEAPQSMSREDAAAILAEQMPLTPIAINHGYTIYTGSQGKQSSEPARTSPISACGTQDCSTPGLVDWSYDLDACTAKVKVGIIDTSFDLTHPALRGIDYETAEFLDGEKPSPFDWHGTAVLSLLGGDSKSGTPGLIPNAKYYLATAFRSDPDGNASTDSVRLVAALEWLERSGVNFINMSFSGPRDRIFEDTVRRMRRKGVVFVAAAGNQGPTAPPSYPGAYPDVIAVTAINRQGENYKFANRGGYIDVSAPGVDVMAALPGAKQGLRTGTSFAAPFVTAIMVAHTGGRAKAGAKRDLLVGLETEDLGPPGDDPIYGRGFAVAPKACGGRAPAVASKTLPSDPPAAAPVSAGRGREEETIPAFSFAPANVFSFGGASAQSQPPSGGGSAGNAVEARPGSMSIGTGFAPNE